MRTCLLATVFCQHLSGSLGMKPVVKLQNCGSLNRQASATKDARQTRLSLATARVSIQAVALQEHIALEALLAGLTRVPLDRPGRRARLRLYLAQHRTPFSFCPCACDCRILLAPSGTCQRFSAIHRPIDARCRSSRFAPGRWT